MKLTPMRYKDYVWPHNPRIYGITYGRKVAVGKVPFGRYVMQDMGMTYRVLSGEGEFAGPGAYDEFKKLATVFYGPGPGVLTHPVWQLSSAYFVSLSLRQEPTEDYVSYAFEFWEDYGWYEKGAAEISSPSAGTETAQAAQSAAGTYTVVSGDTLWGIAARHGVTLSALIAANPQIKNPNLIYAGDAVTIPEAEA